MLCLFFSYIESESHYVPDPEALRDSLREPLPPKQSGVMPPKWLMSSTPEPGSKGAPRTPSNHPTTQYSSPSGPSASKPVRSVSSAGASTQQSSVAPTSTSQGTKQPPLPPPKPVNRGNTTMLGKFCWMSGLLLLTGDGGYRRGHVPTSAVTNEHYEHSDVCSVSMSFSHWRLQYVHLWVGEQLMAKKSLQQS